MKAATSELTNISPSPMPTTNGVERRAATMVPGSSALANTRVKWPSRRRSTASTEPTKSPAVCAVVVRLRHQVDGHLGVGVAGELDAGGLQLVAQRREVLDDAVVDDGDLARRVAVRVRVAVGGTSVGGPAGVTEAGAAGQRRRVGLRERVLQVGQSAGPPSYCQLADAVDQRDARRVVTAVLHPPQRVDDDVAGRLMPDIADDSAHSPSG